MKNISLAIFIFGFLICNSQNKSQLIIGTWKHEKEIDQRTYNEKTSEDNGVPKIIESDEKADLFLTFDKTHVYYNNREFGLWKMNKDSLLIYNKVSKDNEHLDKKIREEYLKDEFLVLKEDGIYFSEPHYLKIKRLSKETLEFGNEKRYSIYTRIK